MKKRPLTPAQQARLDHEQRTHLVELMRGYGWYAVKFTEKTGRPTLFAYGVESKNWPWWGWKNGPSKCFLIGSKNGQGTSWSLRYVNRWNEYIAPIPVPMVTELPVAFQTALGCALWHALIKPELPTK